VWFVIGGCMFVTVLLFPVAIGLSVFVIVDAVPYHQRLAVPERSQADDPKTL
jgi:hypothetical protein